jgi:hypothetical protein
MIRYSANQKGLAGCLNCCYMYCLPESKVTKRKENIIFLVSSNMDYVNYMLPNPHYYQNKMMSSLAV